MPGNHVCVIDLSPIMINLNSVTNEHLFWQVAALKLKKMDFAILSSICVYVMLISIYVLKTFYQCCCVHAGFSLDLEEGLEMVPVDASTDALELEDQIHEV